MTEIILGGGCFWCIDATFRRLKGVSTVACGYAGGDLPYPTYDQVSTGSTGHAEVVRMRFDESTLPVDALLDIFFAIHNPTTRNQQGNDIGPQYRSILFYENEDQRQIFQAAKERAQKLWDTPIVTEITPVMPFYLAEPEHQDYFTKNPESGYCQMVIQPKLIKARQTYQSRFKEDL